MFDIDLRQALVAFLSIVISLTVHEFAHAFVADRLGDPTPRQHGRLTLNPMVLFRAHVFGALIIPIIGALQGFLVGWAATPVNPSKVRRDITVRKADFLITIAGPVSNVLLAIVSLGLYGGMLLLSRSWPGVLDPLVQLSALLVMANLFLAALNMLPIPPLDGFTVFRTIWPESRAIAFLQQYSLILLILFFYKGGELFRPVIWVAHQGLSAMQSLVL
ncbi:MAG: site-2 protease family protein [Myxococcales bacterium]|nr:site-2 protease family protein [Myxococcales bacterium]